MDAARELVNLDDGLVELTLDDREGRGDGRARRFEPSLEGTAHILEVQLGRLAQAALES